MITNNKCHISTVDGTLTNIDIQVTKEALK